MAFILVTAAILLIWCPPTQAEEKHESLERIRQRAIEFARQAVHDPDLKVRVEAAALDPRLKLPACSIPLSASRASGSGILGHTAVAVACQDHHPWRLYVRLQVRALGQVVVARRALMRGSKIEAGDVQVANRDVSQLSVDHTDNTQRVIGRVLRRSIRVDEVVPLGALAVRTLVHTGQRVTLVAGDRQVRISMSGVALSDGAKGEQIRVRNRSSGRIVEGTVIEGGLVDVGT